MARLPAGASPASDPYGLGSVAATQTLGYTEPAIVEIRSAGPTHVRISAPAPGAFVVIAQP